MTPSWVILGEPLVPAGHPVTRSLKPCTHRHRQAAGGESSDDSAIRLRNSTQRRSWPGAIERQAGQCNDCSPASAISARYFLAKTAHWPGLETCWPSFTVSRLGARLGNQTSYQFRRVNSDFGTPRGGRRTVPMRRPSPSARGLPSRTTRITTVASGRLTPQFSGRALPLEARHGRIVKWGARAAAAAPCHGPLQLLVRHLRRAH